MRPETEPDVRPHAPRLRAPRLAFVAAAFIFLSAFGSGERLFAPSADLWDRWTAHDAASTATVDHAAWDAYLAKHLVVSPNGPNRFRYAQAKADKGALDAYVAALAAQPVSKLARPEQMAYWINLYNALTVKTVLAHDPVDSIRDIDISPGLFADGPWDKKLIAVEGVELSLNDIEHRILRPIWKDGRVHYAVNCASIGCPDLQPKAFRAASLDESLDAAARAYVNDPRGVTVRRNDVVVSKIYDWFIRDFGGNEKGVMAHLKRFADPKLKAALDKVGELDEVQYDWSLNDARS